MNKINFKSAEFFTTVNDIIALPSQSINEIAICGRSNSGKSSLINTLTNKTRLAFTSKTPGRTQHINYFTVGDEGLFLVDLPGYGYAKVPEKIRKHWGVILSKYLQERPQLSGLILIMDIRHPLKDSDYTMLNFFAATQKPIHIVLSKADKLNHQQKTQALSLVRTSLSKEFNNCTVQLFSAPKRQGIEELETVLTDWFNLDNIN